eukprot:TRINITY_DN12746_c0_g1_i8.p1 TRINITY_DN12746_c0_g1~~TRINITY_DN12746_c0_g1_i8.p1  ORF type:complete len:324 (-),score=77.14 TRINITY_DN12746_c0_g1_i8:189-1160(-)
MTEDTIEKLLTPNTEQFISMETEESFKQAAECIVLFAGKTVAGAVVRLEDLQKAKVLGEGASGYVEKCLHLPTQTLMAVKVIALTGNTTVNQQIKSELKMLHECDSPNVISSYGAFLQENTVKIALEYMDAGTLQDIVRKIGPIPEVILGIIAHQVIKGLEYLHKAKRVIHRDIKASNILLNTQGSVKIADFGISGCLENSLEGKSSYVGTLCYMAPERLNNEKYFPNSDIWSLGITLVECALGHSPFPKLQNIFEFIGFINKNPTFHLPKDKFSLGFIDFIANCLIPSSSERPNASQMRLHPFVHQYESISKEYLSEWLMDI